MKKISKPILKNPKVQNLVAATLSVGIVGMVLFGAHIAADHIHKDYSSVDQVYALEQSLGAENSYRFDWTARVSHNGDEPIYVDFANEITEQEQHEVEEALDYVFGIVNGINDRYKYEVVDDIKSAEYAGKSSISFQVSDLKKNVQGCIVAGTKFSSIFSSKGRINNTSVIDFDIDMLRESREDLKSVAIHELLHCFGIDDVYLKNNNGYHANTFISSDYTSLEFHKITPNDYKLLASLYAPEFKSQEQFDEYVKSINEKVDEYSYGFYSEYNKTVDKMKEEKMLGLGFSKERVAEVLETTQLDNNIDVTFGNVLNAKDIESIRVKVKGDKFVIATFDKDGVMLESNEGKALNCDGKIYLQNVHLNSFWINGSESFMDMCVSQNASSKEYSLEDLNTSQFSVDGRDFVVENDYELDK